MHAEHPIVHSVAVTIDHEILVQTIKVDDMQY
jgi:hypothetical protein